MNLLFTGSSGFLGKNIKPLLQENYIVKTMGLDPREDYYVNLATTVPILNEYFDIILHAAGKAHHIPKDEVEKQQFFEINFQGTKNLCKALEQNGLPHVFIFISSVAVYGLDKGISITEDNPLNGDTPYALSKIQAEQYLIDWCNKNKIILSILRPSLIAGPKPPGNLGAMINGIKNGRYFSIVGGKARKSILMVEDIARLIPKLILKGGIYNVCDNEHPSFSELETLISNQLGKRNPISIPFFFAKIMAIIGDIFGKRAPFNSVKLSKITKSLTFSNEKIRKELNWEPTNVLQNFRIE